MPRGGKRAGAGRKSSWPSGCGRQDTKLIRVPIALADELLEIARRLDGGEQVYFSDTGRSPFSSQAEVERPLSEDESKVPSLFELDSNLGGEIDFSDAVEPLTLREAAKLVGCASSTLQQWKSKLPLSELTSRTISKSENTVALTFRDGKYYAKRIGNTI